MLGTPPIPPHVNHTSHVDAPAHLCGSAASDQATVAKLSGKPVGKLEKQEPLNFKSFLETLKRIFFEFANIFRGIDQKIKAANTGAQSPSLSLQDLGIMYNPNRAIKLEDSGKARLERSLMPTSDNKMSPKMRTLITHAIKDIASGGQELSKLKKRAPEIYKLLMSEVLTRSGETTTAKLQSRKPEDCPVSEGIKTLMSMGTIDEDKAAEDKLITLLAEKAADGTSLYKDLLSDFLTLPKPEDNYFSYQPRELVELSLSEIRSRLGEIELKNPDIHELKIPEVLTPAPNLNTPEGRLFKVAMDYDKENRYPILINMAQNPATQVRFEDVVFKHIDSPAEAMALFKATQNKAVSDESPRPKQDTVSEMATDYALNCATISTNPTVIDFVKLCQTLDGLIQSGCDIDTVRNTLAHATPYSTKSLKAEMERLKDADSTKDTQNYATISEEIFNEKTSDKSQQLMNIANTFQKIVTNARTEKKMLEEILKGASPSTTLSETKELGLHMDIPVTPSGAPDRGKIATRRNLLAHLESPALNPSAALKILTVNILDRINSPEELTSYLKSQLPEDANADFLAQLMTTAISRAKAPETLLFEPTYTLSDSELGAMLPPNSEFVPEASVSRYTDQPKAVSTAAPNAAAKTTQAAPSAAATTPKSQSIPDILHEDCPTKEDLHAVLNLKVKLPSARAWVTTLQQHHMRLDKDFLISPNMLLPQLAKHPISENHPQAQFCEDVDRFCRNPADPNAPDIVDLYRTAETLSKEIDPQHPPELQVRIELARGIAEKLTEAIPEALVETAIHDTKWGSKAPITIQESPKSSHQMAIKTLKAASQTSTPQTLGEWLTFFQHDGAAKVTKYTAQASAAKSPTEKAAYALLIENSQKFQETMRNTDNALKKGVPEARKSLQTAFAELVENLGPDKPKTEAEKKCRDVSSEMLKVYRRLDTGIAEMAQNPALIANAFDDDNGLE